MDAWIVALRGGSEALVEGRALFGPPVAALEGTEIHAFDAADASEAAQMLLAAAADLGDGTGAAGLEHGAHPDRTRDAVLAAALAAGPGEFLVCGRARTRLADAVVFVRPRHRPGWRIPVAALALAPEPSMAACLAAAATLPPRPPLVGRDSEVDALCRAAAPGVVVVLRAAPGMGGSRVLSESAARAHATLVRLRPADLAHDDAVDRALRALPVEGTAWLALDPVRPLAVPTEPAVAALMARAHGTTLVIRAAPGDPLPWGDPDTDVELGPLAPSESRTLVHALLGPAETTVVSRLARRGGGLPRAVVDAVRLAVHRGEVVRDGAQGAWRWQSRRVIRPPVVRTVPAAASALRTAALSQAERRSLQAVVHLGEGADAVAVGALLRALFGPPDTVETLRSHGLLDVDDGRVTFSAALAAALPVDSALSARIDTLRARGVLDLVAAATHAAPHEACRALALAGRRALAVGDLAAAVRLCATAGERPAGPYAPELASLRGDLADSLGPTVALSPRDGPVPVAPRRLDPVRLRAAAEDMATRGDEPAAARLHALAALALGNAQPGLLLAATPHTQRDHLIGALAHARDGQPAAAVRGALHALAMSRRADDRGGEAAALALLGAVYTALGRDADALALNTAARHAGAHALRA